MISRRRLLQMLGLAALAPARPLPLPEPIRPVPPLPVATSLTPSLVDKAIALAKATESVRLGENVYVTRTFTALDDAGFGGGRGWYTPGWFDAGFLRQLLGKERFWRYIHERRILVGVEAAKHAYAMEIDREFLAASADA